MDPIGGDLWSYPIPLLKLRICLPLFLDEVPKMSKIAVLHLIPGFQCNGPSMVILNLVKNLDPARYHVVICSMYEPDQLMTQELRSIGVSTINLKMESFFDIRAIPKLIRILREDKIDILHTHCFRADLYGRILGRILDIPVIVSTIHNTHVTMFKNDYNRLVATMATWLNRYSAQLAHGLIAISEEVRRHIIEEEKIHHRYIPVIYNGIEIAPFLKQQHKEKTLRSQLGLHSNYYLVGTVSALYPRKGLRYLIEAALHIFPRYPNTRFLIIGDGPLRNTLEEQIASLGLQDKILLMGHRRDVVQLLSILDVFVLSSLSEGVPIAILEAMASGKPVVATYVGGVPEIVQEGITGLLVPPKDAEALANAIAVFIQRPELGTMMGGAGQKRVIEKFSAATMAMEYEKVYRKLLHSVTSKKLV